MSNDETFKVGDIIKGLPSSSVYLYTNTKGWGRVTGILTDDCLRIDWYGEDDRYTGNYSANKRHFTLKNKKKQMECETMRTNNPENIERKKKIQAIRDKMSLKDLKLNIKTNLTSNKDNLQLIVTPSKDLLEVLKIYSCVNEPTKEYRASGLTTRERYRVSNLLAQTYTLSNYSNLHLLFDKELIDNGTLTCELSDINELERLETHLRRVGELIKESFEVESWEGKEMVIEIKVKQEEE